MKLLSLKALRYRSLREETIPLTNLSLFIGSNASGKSTILDALRFLHEGVQKRDFKPPVFSRGGILNLAWKGEEAHYVQLQIELKENGIGYEWVVDLNRREPNGFSVRENVYQASATGKTQLLTADNGNGWWRSGDKQVPLSLAPTACALAAATADASFAARGVAEFVSRWGFFDPNPYLLRHSTDEWDSSSLDSYGRNLAARLLVLQQTSPKAFQQIVSATQSVLGLPTRIELRQTVVTGTAGGDEVYFVQHEPGLKYPVHQVGASSGTLRILALMTALFGETGSNLIGIEEPENHVHPTALAAFADYLLKARDRVQILVTTHSPLLLDFLNEPIAVCVVRHTDVDGTRVARESNAEAVRQALEASGFALGEFYETKGFGS
ncbi:MAG: AAA family ATPase [Gemmataceae bacterium]|nr:AAA family ATPase [Gemmataceae bacterium]MCI0740304.1 AAA family ATPase [Gemmataceae bacterium]